LSDDDDDDDAIVGEILGYQGDEYEDGCLLGYCALSLDIDRHIRGDYCLHHHGPDDGIRKHL
jgi:hypothetical protein